MPDVEAGVLTEEEACEAVEGGKREIEARQGGPVDHRFSEGPSLLIEGSVDEQLVTQCREGTFPDGVAPAVLYCNAILKIAAGELKPTETCGPPDCPEPGTPIWAYGTDELRDLAN